MGGGSAGWMTAAALAKHLGSTHYQISLVESSSIGTVSVGEATIPAIQEFNQMLGIDENAFMRFTYGSFKLGILFQDWAKLGHQYMHPFGAYGLDMNGVPFHHYWLAQQEKKPLETYNLEYQAALANKFTRPIPNSRSPLAAVRYAFHFDATKYAEFLKHYALERGVTAIDAEVLEITQHSNQDIATLVLDNDQVIAGDLFIDCSGFKARLIGDTLGVEYEDWRHYLPCDSAYAQASEVLPKLLPYTISRAHHAGWQWQIPLQHRTGNGLVFASAFMQDSEAEQLLAQQLPSTALADARKLTWINGKRKQAWKANCVAIGLSAGFIEPLESTGLQLIQSGIMKLLALFPNQGCEIQDQQAYNRFTDKEFEDVRDFIVLHYKANQRDDSEFWRYCQNMAIPDSLTQRIELYRASGRIFRASHELFNEISWFSVLNGQGIVPRSFHPFVSLLEAEKREQNLHYIEGAMRESVAAMPSHQAYINQHCRAELPA